MLRLGIGAETLHLESSLATLEAMRVRFQPFVLEEGLMISREAPIHLRAESTLEIATDYTALPTGMLLEAGENETVRIGGSCKGFYSVRDRTGWIDKVRGLGELDALMRLALSMTLPLDGGLLFHGAAFDHPSGSILICGDSGSGKSTAAATFGAACDELSVLRATGESVRLFSTPYWLGRPIRVPCKRILCLVRGGDPVIARLHPNAAFRTLFRHVVRYVAMDSVDRRALQTLARVCSQVDVWAARCPTGEMFLPFVRKAFSLMGAHEAPMHHPGREYAASQ